MTTGPDLSTALEAAEDKYAHLVAENIRLKRYVTDRICPSHMDLPTETICVFGDKDCNDGRAALEECHD